MNDNIFTDMREAEILAYADDLVEKIKELEEEKETYKEVAKKRVEKINRALEEKIGKRDKEIRQCEQWLLNAVNISKVRETKTQRKLELLSGDVVVKKATKKFKNDNKAILEAIKEEREDLVKEKVTTSLDWASFKKELNIIGNQIINITTGEVVEIEGLEIEEVPERLEVK